MLEAHQIGHGASGRAFGQLVPYLKHSHRRIVADFGAARGQALSDAVAAAPAEISAFIEQHQIACAATRTGLLFGARTDAGRRRLEEAAASPRAMLYGEDAAHIVGSDLYTAVCSTRAASISTRSPTRVVSRASQAPTAPDPSANARRCIARSRSRWELAAATGG